LPGVDAGVRVPHDGRGTRVVLDRTLGGVER
jgi:hypothetical protein